jgi:hypothetical protein
MCLSPPRKGLEEAHCALQNTISKNTLFCGDDLSPNVAKPFIDHSTGIWTFDATGYCSTGPELRFLEKGNGMRKTLMAVAAVATLAVSTASPALAWRGGWGPGLAAGLIGGAIVGGAIASSPYYYGPGYGGYYGPGYGYGPAYVGGPYGGPCYWQRQRFWDGYGWRVRSVRVCG